MMAPPAARRDPTGLLDRLHGLGGRLKRVAVLRGLSRAVAVAAGAAVALGLADALLNVPAPLRAVALAGTLAAAGVILKVEVFRALRRPTDPMSLALDLEDRFPDLNDALATTVQFLTADQPPGATPLRKAAAARAVREANDCDFDALVDATGMQQALAAATGAVVVAVGLFLLWPDVARTGLLRLTDPYGNHPWPPRTRLAVLTPDTLPALLARGEPFFLRVAVRGKLPDRATVALWPEGGQSTELPFPVTPDGPERPGSGEVAARFEPNRVSRSFKFRVTAGDGDTGWQAVDVRSAPQLSPLDGRPSPQVRLDYPRYTDLPARDLPDGGSVIETFTGTRVRLRAATDRPVTSAAITYRPETPRYSAAAFLAPLGAAGPAAAAGLAVAGGEVWADVPVAVTDGRRLDADFVPRVSGVYAFRFEDASGVPGTRLLEVRVQADPSPAVQLNRPSASADSLTVLPDAAVTLQAVADDPVFAVRDVWLEYRVGRAGAARVVPLYEPAKLGEALPALGLGLARFPANGGRQPPVSPSDQSEETGGLRPQLARLRASQIVVDRRLSIKELRRDDGSPLKEGDTVTLAVVADDFDDVTFDKPPGRSAEVELQIVSAGTLESLVQQAQAGLRQELVKLREQQHAALQKSADALQQQQATGQLRPQDRDALVQSEQGQQQVRGRVGNPQEGLRAEVNRLKQVLRDSDLPRSATTDRVETLANELDRLAREELDPVEPLLTEARKQADAGTPPDPKRSPLAEAVRHQQQAEQTFKGLLEQLEPWSGAAEVRGEARSLLQEQKKLAEQLGKLGESLPRGRTPEELKPDQRAELDKAAGRQDRLADRLDGLIRKMDRLAQDKEGQAREKEQAAANAPNEPAGNESKEAAKSLKEEADAMRKGVEGVRRDELRRRLAEAGNQIRRNELGNAADRQREAARTLEQVVDALQERREADLDRLAKKLREAEDRLGKLIEEQDELQRKVSEARDIGDPGQRQQALEKLARKQEELQREARELAQTLSRLRNDDAGEAVARAGRQMEAAGRQLERSEPNAAEEVQDDVLDQLEDAERQLKQGREGAEEELLREQTARVAERVKAVRERHEAAVTEAKRIDATAARAKRWDRPLLASLNQLSESQKNLAGEAARLAESRFGAAKVFARVMQQAGDAMDEAAAKMQERKDAALEALDAGTGYDAELEAASAAAARESQELALRRLDQLLDALKPDDKLAQKPQGGGQGGGEGGGSRPPGDGVPPQAQLKALRSLQAEVAERTEAFAKKHPDAAKLTDADRAALKAIRKTQQEVADLFGELTAEGGEGGR